VSPTSFGCVGASVRGGKGVSGLGEDNYGLGREVTFCGSVVVVSALSNTMRWSMEFSREDIVGDF
jgi:hypothetical protein